MTQDWLTDVLHLAGALTDLNSGVAILTLLRLHLGDRDWVGRENGPRVGATIVRKDTGHFFFRGEDEFHFCLKQNAR